VSKEELEKVQAVIAEGVAREGLQDVIAPPEQAAASGPAEFSYPCDGGGPLQDEKLYYPEDEAGYRLSQLASDVAIDRMIADAQVAGVSLLEGPDGLLNQITRTVIERALGAELDDHLGYARGDPAGNGPGNSRNGSAGKTVTTTAGPVRLAVPRDRNSAFEPVIVPKRARRRGQVDDLILSLYARGMTTRDIQAHLAGVYGAAVSPALVSSVTDVVAEEITAWQTRPLDSFYAIVYIDALVVKVRDGGAVENKAAHLVTGVDVDGFKHVPGIWLAASEGAKFWAPVLAELRNRGIKDVLFACCDGLAGITDAVEAAWPKAIVQTCVIHLIRASMRYVAYDQRKKAAAAMRPIYTASSEAAAKAALEGLRREFGKKNPGLVAARDRAWPQFVPFPEFDVAIRKVIYTTNAIESINFQLRKIIKNRGHFPDDDDAAIKLLYLGIRNLTGRHIDGDGLVLARGERGTGTYGWKAALNALAVRFGDRVPV
jgi:putative transposase